MKINLLARLILSITFISTTFSGFSQRIYSGESAEALFNGAELVRESNQSELPSFIRFRKGSEIEMDLAVQWVKKNFQLNPAMGFVLIGTEEDKLGFKHLRYQQTYNGHPIEHAIWIFHTSNDKVYSMNGMLFSNLLGAGSHSVSEPNALESAKNSIGAEVYKWELPEEEAFIKREQNDPNATFFPHGELVYVPVEGEIEVSNYRLAYKFNIYAHSPVSRHWVYVDAATGQVIGEAEIFCTADTPGTAVTVYSGNRTIIADSFGGGYRLRDASRGDGVRTYDMNEGTTYGSAVDFTDSDNFWDNVNADLDEYATDAHWGAEMTYDYYWTEHGRNSIDGNGFALLSYVHYDNGYANAFWDGQRMTYGDGGGGWNPLTALDIAGHEVTHGLTTFTASLVYQAESGALNESFSDIFGTCIEHYARPSDWNWLIGDEIGSALRSMSNPGAYGDPDTYFGNNWASLTGGDNGGVHTNSGVQNYWFYLLTMGGSGTNDNSDAYNVTGIGWDDAAAVAFRNLTVYLTSGSEYADARFYAIQSAVDLFGACSPEVESVTNAWYAVGVGPEYVAGVSADFTSPLNEACSAPFTVNFENLSSNGLNFEWDFGDGNTSTSMNPSHTYTSPGLYTVQLNVDGGACGNDTTIFIDYINIDNALPCIVQMPPSGNAGLQSGCDGTVYDSGGPSGDYGANEDATVTIAPTGAATVTIDFPLFDIEPGTGGTCNYDYMNVYDGPDATAPLIDTYCNNNVPGSITSTGGSITIVFHSDPGLEMEGFQIDWSCNLPTSPPVTDFTSDLTSTCNGAISFTDLSTNGPTSWLWDFGDGNTSTAQHPTHVYTASGNYTVTLTATNSFGNDVNVQTNYITVNLPAGPATTDDNICEDNTANLSASGSGTLNWYDAASGGTLINTGSTYTTPVLSTTTTYYVQEEVPGASEGVGPVDNSFGGGGYFNGDQHLLFDVTAPKILVSVDVLANGSGNRTIELRDNTGTVVQSLTVNIPDGWSTVPLGFDLSIGTDWELGWENGSNPDLYRNNNGPSYPYNAGSGDVTITQSSAGTDYYYCYYNWILEDYPCLSEMSAVNANVSPNADATITPPGTFCTGDPATNLNAVDGGGVWTGPGMSGSTFDPVSAGTGNHEIIYTISGMCGDADTITIPVAGSFDATIDPTSTMCTGDAALNLNAIDAGGTWSGTGITNASTGEFDPSVSGCGTITITYDISGTCGDSDTEDLDILCQQDATITAVGDLCDNDSPVALAAVDAGGTWSGTGVGGSNFNPAVAGPGTHTVTYTISGSCGDTDTEDITVFAAPDATIDPLSSVLCRDQGIYQMTSAESGGTWSADCGTCIDAATGEFDPNLSGEGTWTITYTIDDGTCSDIDNVTVSVVDCLGIGDEDENWLVIYPNPSQGIFTIQTGNVSSGQIVITNVLGQTIYLNNFVSNSTSVDLSEIAARGTYFVKVLDIEGNVMAIQKIVKQ